MSHFTPQAGPRGRFRGMSRPETAEEIGAAITAANLIEATICAVVTRGARNCQDLWIGVSRG